jgi:prepilin-type N-terminal cleavage/methylation domain-containing protein
MKAGFTLIELLVVIAIIAVLSVVVILSLNPAELLRQARDSNRISDMATLKSAISLYLADVTSPFIGTSSICYAGINTGQTSPYVVASSGVWGQPTAASSTCGSWFITATAGAGGLRTSTSRSVNGTSTNTTSTYGIGWIPINFSNISSGAPIGSLPVDPVNTAGSGNSRANGAYFYSYAVISTSTSFKLGAMTESSKYSTGGGADAQTPDGGVNVYMYEQGTNLTGI